MENYRIIRPKPKETFAEALESVVRQLDFFLKEESGEGRCPVYIRFYLSDAQNQAAALKYKLASVSFSGQVSIVEQPPLDGSRIAALVRTSDETERYLFHSLRLTEEEAAGKDSYTQTRLLFGKYLDIIRPIGLELKTHCIRTWIYVRDIDSNYAGVVKARNDVFAEEGLSHDTHYIASTGIGGASEVRSAVVAMDFLTEPGICEADKTYLKALSHLSPTHDYGVAFERGVMLSEGGVVPTGIPSATGKGPVCVPQGDASTGIACPQDLSVAGQELQGVPYFVVYLRDISDYSKVDAYMERRFPGVPRIILEARVCRPGWLIEMECEVPFPKTA